MHCIYNRRINVRGNRIANRFRGPNSVLMERPRLNIDGWPALMSLDMAALYLSIDDATFLRLALDHRVYAVDVDLEAPRWRKVDLDRLTRWLPTIMSFPADPRVDQRLISDADIEKLATAVAKRIGTSASRYT